MGPAGSRNQEIDNLAETLTTLFNDGDWRGSTLPFATAGKWNKAVWSNDDLAEWTCTGVAYSLPLKRGKGNFKTERWLTIQANATGKYLLPESQEPVLHVYLWENACDFDENYNAFPYAVDDEMEATVEMEALSDTAMAAWARKAKSTGWICGHFAFVSPTFNTKRPDTLGGSACTEADDGATS